MVLHPLEFTECYSDSPWFRQSIQQYEEELERTNTQIKQLIKDAKNMLNACRMQSKMMTLFNDRLQNFQFDCIGENLTDDERGIAGSLKEFGLMLEEVACEWGRTIERSELQLIKPLEAFRKDHIHSYRESKKAFEKSSERYYKQLEHTLGLSHKKKEQHLQDSDNELMVLKKHFHKQALKYVYKLQEVQERKKFEFVEHLLMFMQVYFNYFHQSHETANDCRDYMKDLQMRLVATREQYDGTREKTRTLMRRMEDQPDSETNTSGARWSRAGYLFLMEKNTISARFTSKWTKYFCMYTKENKLFQMKSAYSNSNANVVGSVSSRVPSLNHHSSSASGGFLEPMIVKTCTRRITDSIDKRFCFDLELEDTSGKPLAFTLQAISDIDRKKWMSVMDGKEPEYIQSKDFQKKEDFIKLNDIGYECLKTIIAEIERRGVHHEGIYRLVGVMSKVDSLLRQALNPATSASVDYTNIDEWEINTLTSALKSYFRNLPEPVMTFQLHRSFINAAKCENHQDRITKVADLVNKLPEENKRVLIVLTKHLEKVAASHKENKMTVQNLGVCFGPTLLREEQETVQAILEIKFSNIIVEILVEERDIIFGGDVVSLSDASKEEEDRRSPRTVAKQTHVTRLPSQRLKQRPRGTVYEYASIPDILEEGNTAVERAIEHKFPVKFARSRAFRERSTSPKSAIIAEEKRASWLSMSSSDDDGFGHISPLDLNLDFNDITTPSSDASPSTYVNIFTQSPAGGDRVSKEKWTPNGVKSDVAGEKPRVPPRTTLMEKPVIASRSATSGAASSELLEPPKPTSLRRTNSPQPQKRAPTSVPRKTMWSPASGDGNIYAKIDKTNRNNNNNNNHSEKPPKVAKPKSLAVTASILQKKKKIIASMKSPSVPAKIARKKVFPEPVSQAALKTTRLSDSSDHRSSIKKSPHVVSRPISAIIPPAFLIDKSKDGADGLEGSDASPANKEGSPEDHMGVIPRSSALVAGRSPPQDKAPPLSEDNDIIDDDEIPSTVARTLFACEAEQENELSFQLGQFIRDIKKSDEPGWLSGMLNGRRGLVPRNYIEFT